MNKLTAIIVDDCEADQFFTHRVLDSSDLFEEIFQFTEPEDALRFVSSRTNENAGIDLLLVDFRMPRMSGLEFLRDLYARDRKPPIARVAVMSGASLPTADSDALQALVEDVEFVIKPLKRDGLEGLMGRSP